jgi:hypothetical protein
MVDRRGCFDRTYFDKGTPIDDIAAIAKDKHLVSMAHSTFEDGSDVMTFPRLYSQVTDKPLSIEVPFVHLLPRRYFWLREMSPLHRQVYHMRHLPDREVAEILGITVERVERCRRALNNPKTNTSAHRDNNKST